MEGSTRRVTFIEEDDGLASLADMEAGFSGNHNYPILMRSSGFCPSYRALSSPTSSSSSTRSPRFYQNSRFEDHQPHFLEACFLCKKSLRDNRDIFMYRGDTPFCSEECREEQIEIDEAKEKNWNLSIGSMKALRKEKRKTSTSPNKTQNYPVRSGTVAAA